MGLFFPSTRLPADQGDQVGGQVEASGLLGGCANSFGGSRTTVIAVAESKVTGPGTKLMGSSRKRAGRQNEASSRKKFVLHYILAKRVALTKPGSSSVCVPDPPPHFAVQCIPFFKHEKTAACLPSKCAAVMLPARETILWQ